MENTKTRGFDWFSLVMGIIFLFAAYLVFSNPGSSILGVVFAFGIIAILNGIRDLFFRQEVERILGEKSGWLLFMGIVDILFGIMLLFGQMYSIVVVGYLFAIWYIVDSVVSLVTAKYAKSFSKGYYWFLIIFGIIGLIIGIALLFNPMFSVEVLVLLLGIWFAIYGVASIIRAF